MFEYLLLNACVMRWSAILRYLHRGTTFVEDFYIRSVYVNCLARERINVTSTNI